MRRAIPKLLAIAAALLPGALHAEEERFRLPSEAASRAIVAADFDAALSLLSGERETCLAEIPGGADCLLLLDTIRTLAVSVGAMDLASATAEQAVSIARTALAGDDQLLAQLLAGRGTIAFLSGDAAAGRTDFEEAIDIYTAREKENIARLCETQAQLAQHLHNIGLHTIAEDLARQALATYEQAIPIESAPVVYGTIARILDAKGEFEEARSYHENLILVIELRDQEPSAAKALIYLDYARNRKMAGDFDQAETLAMKAISRFGSAVGYRSLAAAGGYLELADIAVRQKWWQYTAENLLKALSIYRERAGETDPNYRLAAERLAHVYYSMGRDLPAIRTLYRLSGRIALARMRRAQSFEGQAWREFARASRSFEGQVRASWWLTRE